ncbi:putative mitochondrial mitochondrial oligo U binding protein TBRGG1 [Leptomonas pyrrhocoris]|uniref:Putative mitochondrial mitochondrial oligo U binding protein TBRGG1 n=1 Tax=Leptomonas pyrrhocoris TaxID=157538 RepID=A0A0N0VGD8_LEPPY|nr:putative mitochondrial mitochondrial oligo U binding protein TBRGG1 [Leptomonas pyrrhocoris]KPA83074.1 putative mitochondrial mitochondrial oligo U binding protein TBRGG1 [Leptomonas pyrrhocoris]|eukprot:XP_015661513.1 putative mitochondrial mitochondrial oligo U binding protein TBRGG1 [Leptomonas pyrrhocoris]
MRRAWSTTAQRFQLLRPYSSSFSPSLALLQRGNPGRDGGSRYGNGTPPPRQQYPPQRGGSYGGRGGGGGNRQQGYNDRERGGYGDSRRQGFGERQRGYDDRPRGSFNRNGNAGNRRRSASDYLAQDAETLLQMKQAYKASKSLKERVQIMREARRLARRVHVDVSTQDERSVIVFLNCAATFHIHVNDGVVEASQWVQANLRGLSPHSVALYANALGLLKIEKRREVFCATVVPQLPSLMRDMTPVEVVMVLQAFERLHIRDCEELMDKLLFQLEPCIPTMPVPQLSTLAEVLKRYSLRFRNEEKWQQVVQAVMSRALESVEGMHSKEAITFLCAAPQFGLPPEQLCPLLARATATAGFHTGEQVAELFHAIHALHKRTPELTSEVEAAVAALCKALVARLEKVASFLTIDDAAFIWLSAAGIGAELPDSVVQIMCDAVRKSLIYRRLRLYSLAHFANAAAAFKLPSPELLDMVAKYSVGERPPRPQNAAAAEEHHEDPEADEEFENLRAATLESLYGRCFDDYVSIRLGLEEAYAKIGANPPAALTTILPERLLQHIPDSPARLLLASAWDILARPPGCPCRNVSNDEALYQGILNDIARTPEKYKNHLTPAFVAKLQQKLAGNAKGEEVVKAVQRALE